VGMVRVTKVYRMAADSLYQTSLHVIRSPGFAPPFLQWNSLGRRLF